jgi:hypothetical protein
MPAHQPGAPRLAVCAASHLSVRVRGVLTPGRGAACARSFRQYHGQRISHAIVMTDALNIYDAHHEAQKDGSAAPRGLDARHRLIGPRPRGALIDEIR